MSKDRKPTGKGEGAAAIEGDKPGPAESDVQIRPAGPEATRDDKKGWDKLDESVDESFPASDPAAKY